MTIVNKNLSDSKPSKIQTTTMTSLGNYGKAELLWNCQSSQMLQFFRLLFTLWKNRNSEKPNALFHVNIFVLTWVKQWKCSCESQCWDRSVGERYSWVLHLTSRFPLSMYEWRKLKKKKTKRISFARTPRRLIIVKQSVENRSESFHEIRWEFFVCIVDVLVKLKKLCSAAQQIEVHERKSLKRQAKFMSFNWSSINSKIRLRNVQFKCQNQLQPHKMLNGKSKLCNLVVSV